MITRIRIQNFRIFADRTLEPQDGLNIIVGENESGKSTVLQAITLALTGRWNGQWVADALTPDWFHLPAVEKFFDGANSSSALPVIEIELYFDDASDDLQQHRGVHNTLDEDTVGVRLTIRPSDEYASEIESYVQSPDCPHVVPVEYYQIDWRSFADEPLRRRPKGLGHILIDSRTIRSNRAVDYHTRQLLEDFVEPAERAMISVAQRHAHHAIAEKHLAQANARVQKEAPLLAGRSVRLDFEQAGARTWHAAVTPRVDEVPFALAGQGVQAAIKIALAMSRASSDTAFVLVEEPENHLSHTRMMQVVACIQQLAGTRQSFITTHSSFVLNRLGLDRLVLLGARTAQFDDLTPDTVRYFQRLSGFDTLRLVLADKLVLVEGPSDQIILERFFQDRKGRSPSEFGIDIVSLRGVALARSLQLCHALDRDVVALRDNDGQAPDHWLDPLDSWLKPGSREVCIGEVADGTTLEPQLAHVNSASVLRQVLGVDGSVDPVTWMSANKTEAALRILESTNSLTPPAYISRALDLLDE